MPENNKPCIGADTGVGRNSGQGVLSGFTPPNAHPETTPSLDGATFDPAVDGPRLGRQLATAFAVMSDGHWRTLRQIAEAVGCSETSASARLRDFRKPRFGGHQVDRHRAAGGVWLYRLILHGKI